MTEGPALSVRGFFLRVRCSREFYLTIASRGFRLGRASPLAVWRSRAERCCCGRNPISDCNSPHFEAGDPRNAAPIDRLSFLCSGSIFDLRCFSKSGSKIPMAFGFRGPPCKRNADGREGSHNARLAIVKIRARLRSTAHARLHTQGEVASPWCIWSQKQTPSPLPRL